MVGRYTDLFEVTDANIFFCDNDTQFKRKQ